jgi:hypothetical protein
VLKTGQSTRTMTAHNQWIALLTCPNGGEPGTVHLSRPEGRACDVSVEALSAGFKVVRVEFGKAFYCKACNRPTDAKHLD